MDQLLRVAAVLDIVGMSRSALYEWMNEGRFPRPHHDRSEDRPLAPRGYRGVAGGAPRADVAMIPRPDTCTASPLRRAATRRALSSRNRRGPKASFRVSSGGG